MESHSDYGYQYGSGCCPDNGSTLDERSRPRWIILPSSERNEADGRSEPECAIERWNTGATSCHAWCVNTRFENPGNMQKEGISTINRDPENLTEPCLSPRPYLQPQNQIPAMLL